MARSCIDLKIKPFRQPFVPEPMHPNIINYCHHGSGQNITPIDIKIGLKYDRIYRQVLKLKSKC